MNLIEVSEKEQVDLLDRIRMMNSAIQDQNQNALDLMSGLKNYDYVRERAMQKTLCLEELNDDKSLLNSNIN